MVVNSNDEAEASEKKKRCPCRHPLLTCLLILTLFVIVCLILLLIIGLVQVDKRYYIKPDCTLDISLEKEWLIAGSHLMESMDDTIDPCTNFYTHACGGFIEKHPIQGGYPNVSYFSSYDTVHRLRFQTLLLNLNTSHRPEFLRRLQESYVICLKAAQNIEVEELTLKYFVKKELGGWPLASTSWGPRSSKEEFLGRLHRFGFSGGFGSFVFTSDPTQSNDTRINLRFVPDSSVLYSFDSNRIFDMTTLMAERMSGESVIIGEEDLQAMLNLSRQIHEIAINNAIEDMTIDDMNRLANEDVDWLSILNVKFQGIYTFKGTEIIRGDPLYVLHISDIIENTPFRTLVNYAIWEVLGSIASDRFASETIQFLFEELPLHDEDCESIDHTRLNLCLNWHIEEFPLFLMRIYVEELIDENAKQVVKEMHELIHKNYKKLVEENEWMDESSINKYRAYIDNINVHVGYPDFLLDDEPLVDYFTQFPFVKSSHLSNLLTIRLLTTRNEMTRFKNKNQDIRWTIHPLLNNIVRESKTSNLWIPVQFLEKPMFSVDRPAFINFALLGIFISRQYNLYELLFDDKGNQVNDSLILSEETLESYGRHMQCYEKQDYCSQNNIHACMNNVMSIKERLADETAIIIAYKAYQNWVEKYGPEKNMAGLEDLTHEQLFFLSYAHMQCENIGKTTSSHGSPERRVNNILANSKDFIETFKCLPGSMNLLSENCSLWQ